MVVCALVVFIALLRPGLISYYAARTGIWGFSNPAARLILIEAALEKAGVDDTGLLYMVASERRSTEELLKVAARNTKLPVEVLEVLHEVESSSGRNLNIRYEAGWAGRAARLGQSPLDQKMLASSHGPMQIAGWWVAVYNQFEELGPLGQEALSSSWRDLYDLEFHYTLAGWIFRRCLDKFSKLPRVEQIKKGFACYNGGGEPARRYSEKAFQSLTKKLVERL